MEETFNTRAQSVIQQRPKDESKRSTGPAWAVNERVEVTESESAGYATSHHGGQEDNNAGAIDNNMLNLLNLGDDQEEERKPANTLDLKRLILGVWQRKIMVILITSVVTALFLLIAIFLVTKTWTSSSVLIKREQIDQFQIGGGSTPFELQNYSFQTMLDTLKLPSTLQLALDRSSVEAKTTQFAGAIGLSKGKQSNLFQIKVTWDDPVVATTLTKNLVDAFIANNRLMRRQEATSIFNYYSAQLSEVDNNAKELDRQIQDFQRDKGVINFDRQSEVALRKIGDLEVEYRSLVAELEEIKRNEGDLSDLIESTPEMTIQTTLYTNPLKKQLSNLEWALEQARGRYTDENPKVIDLIDRIKSLKAVIKEGGDEDTPENVYAINPIRETLLMKQLDNRDVISIKTALARSLKESLDNNKATLEDLTESYRTYSALVQQRESLSDLLSTLRNRVEEARIIMQGNHSDFELIETAAVPSESNPTPKKIIAIAGVILGSGLAILVALLLEFFDPTVKTRREVIALACVDRVFEIQTPLDVSELDCNSEFADSDMALIVRRMINTLEAELDYEQHRLLPITSLERDVGRSVLSRNFAIVSSHKEQATLLVDADVAETAGERSVNSNQSTGLADYLLGRTELPDPRESSENNALFNEINAGSEGAIGRQAILKLSGSKMLDFVDHVDTSQRLILDLPPVARYEPVFELINKLKQVVLVVRASVTKKNDIKSFSERAERAGIEIVAVILTDVDPDLSAEQAQFSASE